MRLFVIEAESGNCIPTYVLSAGQKDFEGTALWQTIWTTSYAQSLLNKVALRRTDNHELLGLMAYSIDETALAVEIAYVESAWHSSTNLLHTMKHSKKYFGIAKGLFAYAADISCSNGFDGVLFFKDKFSYDLFQYVQEVQRLEQAKPVLAALSAWANTRTAAPKSTLGKAFTYLKEQWPYLVNYLRDGKLTISNNRAEQSIKPFVIDRKKPPVCQYAQRGHRQCSV